MRKQEPDYLLAMKLRAMRVGRRDQADAAMLARATGIRTLDGMLSRQAMLDEEPPATGDERHDAYVGAVAEHLARCWRLNIPDWSDAAWREVARPWFVGAMGVGLSGVLLVESPIAFRRRRIFTEAEPLRRARMPANIPMREVPP